MYIVPSSSTSLAVPAPQQHAEKNPHDSDCHHTTMEGSSEMSFRKRKRVYEDGDDALSGRLSFLSTSHQPFTSSPTLATSPSSLFSDHFEASKPENPQTVSRFRLKTTFPLPKRRLLDPNTTSHRSPPKPRREASHTSSDATNVSSCHICHRRPTTVQDLPSFTDCEACGLRTCFVCLRACESARCHQHGAENEHISISSSFVRERRGKRVCGNCCTEVGVEGTVWCLVCYEDDEDEEVNPLKNRDKKELHDESVQKVSGWLQRCGGQDDG